MENYNINVILVGRRENHGIAFAGKWLKFSVKHFNLFFYKKF